MLGSYTNYMISVDRPSAVNVQGERGSTSQVAAVLGVFAIAKGSLVESPRGWIKPYDALGYVAEGNAESYTPVGGDLWIFESTITYEVVRVQRLKGMGDTQYGFRVELKAQSEAAGLP